jgi:hypothetical protein
MDPTSYRCQDIESHTQSLQNWTTSTILPFVCVETDGPDVDKLEKETSELSLI